MNNPFKELEGSEEREVERGSLGDIDDLLLSRVYYLFKCACFRSWKVRKKREEEEERGSQEEEDRGSLADVDDLLLSGSDGESQDEKSGNVSVILFSDQESR